MNLSTEELEQLQVKLAQLATLSTANERDTLTCEILLGYWRILNQLIDQN
jgi:hypothetical protein